ncbi:MAG: hypothetical protein IJ272_09185 [Clostridia bacterium]|nr:hypothetical protein [Clostridia bacterium]
MYKLIFNNAMVLYK